MILESSHAYAILCCDGQTSSEKALSLLNDKTYTILQPNPTGKTRKDLNKRLLLLKNSNKINEVTYQMLHSSNGLYPRLCGLPKIHKPGIPLRPIVSFVNSPTCNVSCY